MSIFKDTFRPFVRDQLAIREELVAIDSDRQRRSKEIILPRNDKKIVLPAGSFYNYTTNRSCVIRMTSMVDYVDNVNLEIGGLEGKDSFNALRGAALSRNFILEGGVVSDFSRKGKEVRRFTTPRDSFPRPKQRANLGYGDFSIGSDASEDGYGIVPMPGIIDANVRTKSAYGSLREAKVNFECHNKRQLEVLEMLYMRPGYMVALEWGWAPYINNEGQLVSNLRLLENETNDKIYTNKITQEEVFSKINKLKEQSSGNYDGFLGFVKNFGFQAREDGGFSCYTELISIGEVMESLKIPSISIIDPDSIGGENSLIGSSGNVFVSRTTVNGNEYGGSASSSGIGKAQFNEAINSGIFPRYNGLEGLIRALNSYASFGPDSNVNKDKDFFNEELKENFSEFYTIAKNEEDDQEYTNRFNEFSTTIQDAGYSSRNYQEYLLSLLKYQGATFEPVLINKLGLSNKEDLKHYIISRGRNTTVNGAISRTPNRYGYIRWDALCILINEFLIPKNEKGTPLRIVSDRIYSQGTGNTTKFDPLLLAPISDYTQTGPNEIFDFSCDADVCILPMQFFSEFDDLLGAQSSQNFDALGVNALLGYTPDLTKIPTDYIIGSYSKKLQLTYEGKVLSKSTRLTNSDKVRRIGSVFINIDMLVDMVKENSDNQDYTLGKFINDLWEKINKVCPNHNFVLTDDKESNVTFIIDLPVDNTSIPKTYHEFVPFSDKNILRKFEYTSNVPKAMSATIAIQSQDPRSIQDIDGVTFAAFNKSIKNRLLSNDITSNFDKLKNDVTSQRSQYINEQSQLSKELNTYMVNFFNRLRTKISSGKVEKTKQGGPNIMGVLKTYQKNASYLSSTKGTDSLSINSVIPLEFNATLDGISGIVIGNMFKVRKDRLPKAYSKANIAFIVFNEDQQITAGGDWTTNIGGKMTLLPSDRIVIEGIKTNFPYTGEPEEIKFTSNESTANVEDTETEYLPQAQQQPTDVSQLQLNDPVYLKYIRDDSISWISLGTTLSDDRAVNTVDPRVTGNQNAGVNTYWTLTGTYYWAALGPVDGYENEFGEPFPVFTGTIKVPRQGGANRTLKTSPINLDIVDGKVGFTAVRDTPGIDNEDLLSGKDNAWGLFDSYNNGGLLLGKVKGTNAYPEGKLVNKYPGNKVAILSGKVSQYIDGIDPNDIEKGYTFISTEKDPSPEGNYTIQNKLITRSDGVEFTAKTETISKDDCTKITDIWYLIEFTQEASDLFLGGWVRDSESTNAALYPEANPWTNSGQGRGDLRKISQTLNCWMRSDTIAASAEKATAFQILDQNSDQS